MVVNCDDYDLKMFLPVTIMWAFWTTPNKFVKFPKSPTELLLKIYVFLQKWRVLLGGEDPEKMQKLMDQEKGWLKPFLEKILH